MELIPILSTIILVATISTFILAVGAYILFKIREDRSRKQPVRETANLQAEYIVPKDQQVKKVLVEDIVPPNTKRTLTEDRYKNVFESENVSAQHQNFAEGKQKDKQIELPKRKFVNVKALDVDEQQNEFEAGEIKWR